LNKKTRFRKEAGCVFLSLATPLSYPDPAGLRPEALRPNLSEGLPFSKSILLVPVVHIGIALKKLQFFFKYISFQVVIL
jgi:hypothetical protein